jgi:streptogramin lyase
MGVITEFVVPTYPYGAPRSITAGPDGNVWYTDDVGYAVGRVTPQGIIDSFAVKTAYPEAITFGSDGNLWFTYINTPRLGTCTPGGVTSEKMVPNETNGFTGIVGGPDGNIWFGGVNEILRTSVSGTVTPFPQPMSGSTPYPIATAIAVGGDGNLWYDDLDSIARMTPEGSVTKFSVHSAPRNITRGPDGNVWFAGGTPEIGRLTPAGQAAYYAVPSAADGIAGGPDGNIWFTENTVRRIARFRLAP